MYWFRRSQAVTFDTRMSLCMLEFNPNLWYFRFPGLSAGNFGGAVKSHHLAILHVEAHVIAAEMELYLSDAASLVMQNTA